MQEEKNYETNNLADTVSVVTESDEQGKPIPMNTREENKDIKNEKNLKDVKGTKDIKPEKKKRSKKSKKNKKKEKKIPNFILLPLSIFLALLIWMYVVNVIDNADQVKTFNSVAVNVDGVAALEDISNLSVISGFGETVDVTLRGKRADLEKLDVSSIRAYIDVSDIEVAGKTELSVKVEPIANLVVERESLGKIEVTVDRIISKEVGIVISPRYTISGSYFVDSENMTANVESIRIEGPASDIERISHAVAEPNVGKLTGSVQSTTSVYFVDSKGLKVQNPYIKSDVNTVEIGIPVLLKKYINLTYEYDENLFKDYNVSIQLEFDTVCIVGDVLKVSHIEEVCVITLTRSHFEETDEDGNYKPYEKTVEIKLPEGVTIEGELNKVYVKAEITKKMPDGTEEILPAE